MSTHTFTMNESFPMNAWYAAVRDVGLNIGFLTKFTANKSVVVYRKLGGTPIIPKVAFLAIKLPMPILCFPSLRQSHLG